MPMNKARKPLLPMTSLLVGALLALALAAGASAASRSTNLSIVGVLDAEGRDGEDHLGLPEDRRR